MEGETVIQALRERLRTGDLGTQITALEEGQRLLGSVCKVAVEGFRYTDNPVVYCDWLSRFGPSIVPELEGLYRSLEEGEARTQLAILLLYLGNKTGLQEVLAAVAPENPCAILAASKLANAGIAEAGEPIAKLLSARATSEPMDFPHLASWGTLICALIKLSVPIPEEVRKRLTGPGVPEWVSAYLPKD